jgi:hypothetical protein
VLNPNDVLMGRGSGVNDSEGNRRFRWIIEQKKDEYFAATKKKEKREIAQQVLNEILGRGGRFLQQNTASSGIVGSVSYANVDLSKALKKCLHALREKKRHTFPLPGIFEQQVGTDIQAHLWYRQSLTLEHFSGFRGQACTPFFNSLQH